MDREKGNIVQFWFRTEYALLPEKPNCLEEICAVDGNMADTHDKQEGGPE